LYQLLDAVIQLETLSTELNSEEMASPCKTI
jgi:hypothetical protein